MNTVSIKITSDDLYTSEEWKRIVGMINGMLAGGGYDDIKAEIDWGVKQPECEACDGKGQVAGPCKCCKVVSIQPCEVCNGTGLEKSGS